MKIKSFLIILSSLYLLLVLTSCAVVVLEKKDNGKHKGWTKNSNNPHHPNSTNPGKGNGKPGKRK